MDGGIWRTVGGRRIFIKEGQDLASAMKESGKFESKKELTEEEKDKKAKELKKEIKELYKKMAQEDLSDEEETKINEKIKELKEERNKYTQKEEQPTFRETPVEKVEKPKIKKGENDNEEIKKIVAEEMDESEEVAGENETEAFLSRSYEKIEEKLGRELDDEDYELISEEFESYYDKKSESYVSKKGSEEKAKEIETFKKDIAKEDDYVKNHNYIKENLDIIENKFGIYDRYSQDKAREIIKKSMPEIKKIDNFTKELDKVADVNSIDTSKKSVSTYIKISRDSLKNEKFVDLMKKKGVSKFDIDSVYKEKEDGDLVEIRISNHKSGGKFNMEKGSSISYNSGDLSVFLENL